MKRYCVKQGNDIKYSGFNGSIARIISEECSRDMTTERFEKDHKLEIDAFFEYRKYLRDLIIRNISEGLASPEIEDAVNVAYDYIYESITRTLLDE